MWKKEKVEWIIKNSTNKSEVLKKMNLKIFTGNYDTLNRYIKNNNIDISHFNRKIKNSNKNNGIKIPSSEILVENSTYTSTNSLKQRLYKEGLKERKCELCGQEEEWKGKHMSLILDHINGIRDDNRLENLRIVCPNCNATLDTHCGKNSKYKKIIEIKIKNIKMYYYCNDCGIQLSKKSNHCLDCYNKKQRKVERPPYEQLIKEINELGWSGTGRKYGVSDNSIRKWVKYYKKQ